MSIGSRIRALRLKRGLTQRELGRLLGFDEVNADTRIANYESERREPRKEILNRLADALNVDVGILNPDSKTIIGKFQMLFALEDDSDLQVVSMDGNPVLSFQFHDGSDESLLIQILMRKWAEKAELLRKGAISQEEYDQWRYNLK